MPLGTPHDQIAGVADRLAGGDALRLGRPVFPAA
jgi:hypothetical protein